MGHIVNMAKTEDWEELFRLAIKRSGLNLTELSKRTDVDKSQLSRFMHGQRGLSIKTAERVAREVGLDLKSRKGK
jgi:transcriptional regulator with XRE-family HTH domain